MVVMAACLAIMAGLFAGIMFPAVKVCIFAFQFAGVFAVKLLIKRKISYEDWYIFVVSILFFVSAFGGFIYDKIRFDAVAPLYGTEVTISGTVTEAEGLRFILDDGKKSYNVYSSDKKNYVYKNECVTVTGKLTGYNTSSFGGDTNFRVYCAVRGIYGKISADSVIVTGYDDGFSLAKLGGGARELLHQRIDENDYFHHKAFIKALLTGSTDDLDLETRENFSLTGIAHLISVSGLHFGIFLAFFSAAIFKLRRHRIVKNLFVVILVLVYVVLIGERASVFRAAGMTVLGYSVSSMKRRRDSLTNLMLMGVAICLVNPYYVADAGFQMSFIATLGIVLYVPYIKNQIVGIPIITMLFMLPVTLYYNNVVSLESVFVNIIAVALSPFVIVFGYIGCIIPVFGALSSIFSGAVLKLANVFADMDFLHISVPSTDLYGLIIWLGLAAAAYFILKDMRIDDAVAAIFTAMVALVFVFAGNVELTEHSSARFVNTGNYNMVHIVSENGANIFVDCGNKADRYMTKYGIEDIYAIMITDDGKTRYSDLEKVCEKRNVTIVLLPEKLRKVNFVGLSMMCYKIS